VVTICKCSINPITNSSPTYTHLSRDNNVVSSPTIITTAAATTAMLITTTRNNNVSLRFLWKIEEEYE
jgi:hypothetical protein